MGRGTRLHGVGRRRGERGGEREREHEPRAEAGSDEPGHGEAGEQDDPAQPRQPGRCALEEHERPDHRHDERARQRQPRYLSVPLAPRDHDPDPDEGADRRSENDVVVRVDDALHEAEHETGDDEPRAPHEDRGAPAVGALRRPHRDEQRHERDERCRQQPGDLRAHLGAEKPQEARRAPPPCLSGAHRLAADHAAGLVAGDAAEAVVTEDQVEDAVVLRAADVGTTRRRPERDDGDPPAGGRDQRHPGRDELRGPVAKGRGRRDQVDERESRHHEQRLQHLRQESQPDEHADEQEPARPSLLERACQCVGGADEQQRQQRVGVVEAEHEHRHRRQREHGTRDQSRGRPETAAHGCVEQRDGGNALECLRDEDAPRVDAEEPR